MSIWAALALVILFGGGLMIWDIIHAPQIEDYEWSEHETRGKI